MQESPLFEVLLHIGTLTLFVKCIVLHVHIVYFMFLKVICEHVT